MSGMAPNQNSAFVFEYLHYGGQNVWVRCLSMCVCIVCVCMCVCTYACTYVVYLYVYV